MDGPSSAFATVLGAVAFRELPALEDRLTCAEAAETCNARTEVAQRKKRALTLIIVPEVHRLIVN